MDPERGDGRGMEGGADVGEEEEGYIITESIKRVFFIKPKRKLPFRSPPPATDPFREQNENDAEG